jgi:hypothetical protein
MEDIIQKNWLPDELLTELDGVKPEGDDIDANGVVNTQKLQAAAAKVFYNGRHFHNFYQAHKFTQRFGDPWGMKVTTEGMRIYCAFGAAKKKKRETVVSPAKQRTRETSLKEVHCPWSLNLSPHGKRKDEDGTNISRAHQQVKIAS